MKLWKELKKQNPKEIQTKEMIQGQKQTRFIAWTFHTKVEQQKWFKNNNKQATNNTYCPNCIMPGKCFPQKDNAVQAGK